MCWVKKLPLKIPKKDIKTNSKIIMLVERDKLDILRDIFRHICVRDNKVLENKVVVVSDVDYDIDLNVLKNIAIEFTYRRIL